MNTYKEIITSSDKTGVNQQNNTSLRHRIDQLVNINAMLDFKISRLLMEINAKKSRTSIDTDMFPDYLGGNIRPFVITDSIKKKH
tara:strand:- start:8313 stop:8567 length:255 start_codon:yes stop_codon:yes gene_type:complete